MFDQTGGVKSAMSDARAVMGEIQQMLEYLHQHNQQDGPEYQELFMMAQELNEKMRRGRTQQEVPAPVPAAVSPTPGRSKLLDAAGNPLPPIKATLGMEGRRGIVSAGPEVETLQTLLNHLGLRVPTSGTFDLLTATAVKELQKRRGLNATGMVGMETRLYLNSLL